MGLILIRCAGPGPLRGRGPQVVSTLHVIVSTADAVDDRTLGCSRIPCGRKDGVSHPAFVFFVDLHGSAGIFQCVEIMLIIDCKLFGLFGQGFA